MNKEKMQISSPTSSNTSSTRIIGTTGSPCCDGTRSKRTVESCVKNKSTIFVIITNENHHTRFVFQNLYKFVEQMKRFYF